MDILFFVSASAVLALLLITAPLTFAVVGYALLMKTGLNSRVAIGTVFVSAIALLAWPLSGLYGLSEQCEKSILVRAHAEKLGPIDTLLIYDGIGRWWQDQSHDLERPLPGGGFQWWQANGGNRKRVTEGELRSRYRIRIEPPHGGDFFNRYQASGSILIEERASGNQVASFVEPAWGGGVVGAFIASVVERNPFHAHSRYLSCGYTGRVVGVFRGNSEFRQHLYQSADHNLVEQVFTFSPNR